MQCIFEPPLEQYELFLSFAFDFSHPGCLEQYLAVHLWILAGHLPLNAFI